MRLCWENVSWCMFAHPSFATALLEHCPSDNLGFVLDIKQAVRSGYSPLEYLDAMGDRLAHIHLLDYETGSNGRLNLALPLRGTFDFAQFRERLQQMNYQGDAMIETYSDLYQQEQEVFACWKNLKKVMEY
jgi:sugar phosphate isomerase/epimerase